MPAVSPITTHILDTAKGKPAAGVPIKISILSNGSWQQIGAGTTNSDGRVTDLLPSDKPLAPGTYQMHFNTGDYFAANNEKGFYPYVEVTFDIVNVEQHYHVPLLLNPFGYSTYRGS